MVSQVICSFRVGPEETWQCTHFRLQVRPMLT